jgi:arylsulfatase A-like enzyme
MNILYIDIDSLRADHLGCYGYSRNTSPVMDSLAARGVRFENVYVSDAPCLPSRTALWSGRNGRHTGVINHGGTAAEPFIEGPGRGFRDYFGFHSWMRKMRELGYYTATISSFGERHSAWHWYAGFNEIFNPGKGGLETADEVSAQAISWLGQNSLRESWFLHVNMWDPHTPYITPDSFGNAFKDEPLPAFYTEQLRQRSWNGYGPHSAQEPHHYDALPEYARNGKMPVQLDSMNAVKQWIDGYDTGVRFADYHIGRMLEELERRGLLDNTAVMISADHGENLGELNVWGDHQTADQPTSRVPLIVSWPGYREGSRVDAGLHYHFDWAATTIELAGGEVPSLWDGKSFAAEFKNTAEVSRPYLVLSQGAWSCQRSVRFDNYICLRTYHSGLKQLDPVMLFNIKSDPHEQNNLAGELPEVVNRAMKYLEEWEKQMAATSNGHPDPMQTVLSEGGPFHARGYLSTYLTRLRETGRAHHADALERAHAATS